VPGRRPANELTPLGQRLEALRQERGLTRQADAADLIGISLRTYGRLLHQPDNPGLATLMKIAAAYNVDHRDLIDAPPTPNGDLARLERKLDLILDALITSGAIPDPPDELRDLIHDAANGRRRPTAR
jgi:transcriptional regulator with XRE-family HTH domain